MDKTIKELLSSVSEMDSESRVRLVKLIQGYCTECNQVNSEKVIAKIIFEIMIFSNVERKKTF